MQAHQRRTWLPFQCTRRHNITTNSQTRSMAYSAICCSCAASRALALRPRCWGLSGPRGRTRDQLRRGPPPGRHGWRVHGGVAGGSVRGHQRRPRRQPQLHLAGCRCCRGSGQSCEKVLREEILAKEHLTAPSHAHCQRRQLQAIVAPLARRTAYSAAKSTCCLAAVCGRDVRTQEFRATLFLSIS